jgi:alkylhydroperoxidase family enzyme
MTYAPSQPARDDVPPEEREFYDRVVQRFRLAATAEQADDARRFGMLREPSEVGYFFGALLHSPRLAASISELGRFYRSGERPFSPRDREWVVEAVAHAIGCKREIYAHLAEAIDCGVRAEALAALHAGRDDELTPEERQLADYARQVVRGQVTEEAYKAMEARFGVRATLELTAFASHLLMAARIMQAIGADWIGDDAIEAELTRLQAGGSTRTDR